MDFPGGPVVKTLHFHCRKVRVRSLVGELGSSMPYSMTKKKKKAKSRGQALLNLFVSGETENMGRLLDLFKAAPEIDGKARTEPRGMAPKTLVTQDFNYTHDYCRTSLVAQGLKRLPAMRETWVRSLGQEDSPGEGNGNPPQYSCLENPMDGGAWWATVHGVAKSQTRLSDFTSLHLTVELVFKSVLSSSPQTPIYMNYYPYICL